jgi:xanthine/uracil/vitamin C permease (AzgA family)
MTDVVRCGLSLFGMACWAEVPVAAAPGMSRI